MSDTSAAAPAELSLAKRMGKDALSGFLVFLIALPLCLAIAAASGFPPVAGVLSAIVGGVMVSFIGSAELTIKGPAAGLIVIALGAVAELGGEDPVLGYKRALAVGMVAAVIQIAIALSRAGVIASIMPPSVVHGMLAAIGVIIIAKQTPVMFGVEHAGGEPLEMLWEMPHYLMEANPEVLLIGVVSLLTLIILPFIPVLKKIPAPLVALILTVPMGLALHFSDVHMYTLADHSYELGPQFLVNLPGNLLDAVTFPDFSVITSPASLKYIVMFALVGTIESLLSVIAVDSMDPEKRVSDLNKDLLATGIGNLISAGIGGLPMISEIVRSKANLDAGAKSKFSNFFHGVWLLLFVALLPGLLQQIPMAALAAMLVFTGARLASPKEFIHAWKIGWDQLLLFLVTFAFTLGVDLLVGVGVGLALKLVLHLVRGAKLSQFFKNPLMEERVDDTLVLRINGPAVFTNLLPVRKQLQNLEPGIKKVILQFSDASLVDHTFLEKVELLAGEWPDTELVLEGLDELHSASTHKQASHRKVA